MSEPGAGRDGHSYKHLGEFSGLVDLVRSSWSLFGDDQPSGPQIRERLEQALGMPTMPVDPGVTVDGEWRRDGIDGTVLSWDVGFGPRTEAWLLRPAGERGALPGAIAMHCHAGQKRFGKEKLADGPLTPSPAQTVPSVARLRDDLYGGRPVADDLARRGYAVLVHDVFGWGSRRFPVAAMPERSEHIADLERDAALRRGALLDEAEDYDLHAGPFEDAMAKTAGVLGTSWAGLIAREDLIALDVLRRMPDVTGASVFGLSGGGARAALVSALSDDVSATGIISMMASLDDTIEAHLHHHSWTLMTPGLGRVADLPDIAAARAPRPLFVAYASNDQLFPERGMRRAHDTISRRYAGSLAYSGRFFDAPHSFDRTMQVALWDWLDTHNPAPSGAHRVAGPNGKADS